MSPLAFDSLKAARSFREAGADEKLAEAMASAIGDMADAVEGQLATKTDLNALKTDLNKLEKRIVGPMDGLERRTACTTNAPGQRTASAMEALEQRMEATLCRALWLQTGIIIAAVTTITKLLP